MPYNEQLAERVRGQLKQHRGFSERKMFGGVCFMLNGNMCCGVAKDDLMLRIGAEAAEKSLKKPHTREMDFTGRPLKSMVYVEPEGIARDEQLWEWLRKALDFGETLPAK